MISVSVVKELKELFCDLAELNHLNISSKYFLKYEVLMDS